jgi:hypothetical protein
MFRRTVTAPDGKTWKVGRRWAPRRPHIRRARGGDAMFDGFMFDDLWGVLLGILLVVVVLVLFNVLAIAVELLFVLVVLVAGVFGRVVLRRPWVVEARAGGESHEFPVVGWRASEAKIDEISMRLGSGAELDAPRLNR